MQELKRKIEAVLFTIGRPVTVAQIMELAKYNQAEKIQTCLDELVSEYKDKESSIEILKDNNRYRMNIKSDFMPLVKDLMPNTELDRPTIATLAVVSWKQPILQSRVVKIRGNTAYEHVKLLEDLGFVTTERQGLSKSIKLSPKFYEYFDTNKEALQQTLAGKKEKQVLTEVPDLLANIQNITNIPMPNTTQIELPKVTNVDIPNVTNIEMPGTPEITTEDPLNPQPPKVGLPKKEHKNVTQIETPKDKGPTQEPKEKAKEEKEDNLEKLKETNPELFEDLEEGTEVVLNKNV